MKKAHLPPLKSTNLPYFFRFHSLLILALLILFFYTPLPAQSRVKLQSLNLGIHTKPGQNPNNPNVLIPEAQLAQLLDTLVLYTEGIRTFGVDTNLQKVPRLAKERGLKVSVGIWIGSSLTENEKQIKKGIEIAKAGYADKLIVGSEALLRRDVSASKLLEYINRVKQACPNIPVSTADVYYELVANPAIIAACSTIDINIYPFWEGVPIECALQRFHQAYLSVVAISGGKIIWISESGWKSKGRSQGRAIASLANAVRYNRELLEWKKAHGVDVCIFEAFDEPWKGDIDDGWGIFDNNLKLKPGMEVLFKPITKIDSTWLCKKGNTSIKDTLVVLIPPIGAYLPIKGHVNLLPPCDYKIIIYIKVPGANWWTKPTFAQPSVPILCDGTWEAPYATGGNDRNATDICVFVVPASYKPPACSGCSVIPAEVYKNAVTWKCISRPPLTKGSVKASKDTVCQRDTVTIKASGGPYFFWSTNQTTSSITVSSSGTYSVTAYDGQGGGSTAEVKIEFLPLPNIVIEANPNTPGCPGQPITVTASGGNTYKWTTGHTSDRIIIHPQTSNTVEVKGTDKYGCSNTRSKYIAVRSLPFVKIYNLDTFYKLTNDSVKMIGQPQGGKFSGNGVVRNVFYPAKAGIGKHTICYSYTDANGCANKDSVIVTISAAASTPSLPPGIASIKIFPNPIRDRLSLEMATDRVQTITIYLSDLYGRQLMRQQSHLFHTGGHTIHLYVKGLPAGAHILSIEGDTGSNWSKPIIIEPN